MSNKKKIAFVMDLDGTINHKDHIKDGFYVKGRVSDSFIAPKVMEKLARLSWVIDIIVATGRAVSTVSDFKKHFEKNGVKIKAWILEHGAFCPQYPLWANEVLKEIDLNDIFKRLVKIIKKQKLPIDYEKYKNDHKGMILLSGKGAVMGEYLIDLSSHILKNRFRTITGKRKIAIIPAKGEKFNAFQYLFGKTHSLLFAAGDQPDDLFLLKNSVYAFAPFDSSPIVKNYIKKRKGYISGKKSHDGTMEFLDIIWEILNKRKKIKPLPGPRLPLEEMESFRPSAVSYGEILFNKIIMPSSKCDLRLLKSFGKSLHNGKNMAIEVKMRDWGGEIKPLVALCHAIIPYLPHAKWILNFREERRGVENLKNFSSIEKKLKKLKKLPDGKPRFSAPGVPGSPKSPLKPSVSLWLYDYPEDLGNFYNLAMTRLVTRHPLQPGNWFVNPMYLKIEGARLLTGKEKQDRKIKMAGSKIMMAANIVDQMDIKIAIKGYDDLKKKGLADSIIIAPRVITNKNRNNAIKKEVYEIGEKPFYLSLLSPEQRPGVLFVDTYGDLKNLYENCIITYLGGGFDTRKRGFDPMESLVCKVPVITGPIFDYNKISIKFLYKAKWTNILKNPFSALDDFVEIATNILKSGPDPSTLENFIKERRQDGLRVAGEIMGDLTGKTKNKYIFPENNIFPRDKIKISELII